MRNRYFSNIGILRTNISTPVDRGSDKQMYYIPHGQGVNSRLIYTIEYNR